MEKTYNELEQELKNKKLEAMNELISNMEIDTKYTREELAEMCNHFLTPQRISGLIRYYRNIISYKKLLANTYVKVVNGEIIDDNIIEIKRWKTLYIRTK